MQKPIQKKTRSRIGVSHQSFPPPIPSSQKGVRVSIGHTSMRSGIKYVQSIILFSHRVLLLTRAIVSSVTYMTVTSVWAFSISTVPIDVASVRSIYTFVYICVKHSAKNINFLVEELSTLLLLSPLFNTTKTTDPSRVYFIIKRYSARQRGFYKTLKLRGILVASLFCLVNNINIVGWTLC